MSYCIDYVVDSSRFSDRKDMWMLLLMSLTVFALFLSAVRSYRPEIWTSLQAWFWPGDFDVTRNAAKVLLMEIQAGQPVADAAVAFCREILHHAGIL